MDLEQFMKDTPRDRWPKFLQAAAKTAEQTGKTVRQVLDEDLERLRKTHYLPQDDSWA